MKPALIVSSFSAALCLVLSIWLFFANSANQVLQGELQTRQDSLQTQQQAVQLQQEQLRSQQQTINEGTQLAQQIGPAVLRDLGALALQNKNENIRKLLAKYGVTVKEPDPAAPPPAAPKP